MLARVSGAWTDVLDGPSTSYGGTEAVVPHHLGVLAGQGGLTAYVLAQRRRMPGAPHEPQSRPGQQQRVRVLCRATHGGGQQPPARRTARLVAASRRSGQAGGSRGAATASSSSAQRLHRGASALPSVGAPPAIAPEQLLAWIESVTTYTELQCLVTVFSGSWSGQHLALAITKVRSSGDTRNDQSNRIHADFMQAAACLICCHQTATAAQDGRWCLQAASLNMCHCLLQVPTLACAPAGGPTLLLELLVSRLQPRLLQLSAESIGRVAWVLAEVRSCSARGGCRAAEPVALPLAGWAQQAQHGCARLGDARGWPERWLGRRPASSRAADGVPVRPQPAAAAAHRLLLQAARPAAAPGGGDAGGRPGRAGLRRLRWLAQPARSCPEAAAQHGGQGRGAAGVGVQHGAAAGACALRSARHMPLLARATCLLALGLVQAA